jgi:hypothetical protein
MQGLTALACAVIGLEWHALARAGTIDDVWRASVLGPSWGWLRLVMRPSVTRWLGALQVALAMLLALAALQGGRTKTLGAFATAGLAVTVWLSAVRLRSTVNGGSDGMLFTLLLGLTIATWPGVPDRVATAGVLFVAAQVLLSYLRAGLVKVREPSWRRGEALRDFLAIPAYGVPPWVPRTPTALRLASFGVMCGELAAPLALLSPWTAIGYGAVALVFHAATAVVFGLHRFLLVWTAALPSLWVAQAILHR